MAESMEEVTVLVFGDSKASHSLVKIFGDAAKLEGAVKSSEDVTMTTVVRQIPKRLHLRAYDKKRGFDNWKGVDSVILCVNVSGSNFVDAFDYKDARNSDNGPWVQQIRASAPLVPYIIVGINPSSRAGGKRSANNSEFESDDWLSESRRDDAGCCQLDCCCYHPVDCKLFCQPFEWPDVLDPSYGIKMVHKHAAHGYTEVELKVAKMSDEEFMDKLQDIEDVVKLAIIAAGEPGFLSGTLCCSCLPNGTLANCCGLCEAWVRPKIEGLDIGSRQMYPLGCWFCQIKHCLDRPLCAPGEGLCSCFLRCFPCCSCFCW
eukprot:m.96847 g.96847  ORF g.96847 m.96847 type:complete len:317 (+) comp26932_c0_seq1:327-1277(+)